MRENKKMIYITTVDKATDPGVFNKICYQVSSFERLGYNVTLSYFDGAKYFLGSSVIYKKKSKRFHPLYERFLFPNSISKAVLDLNFDFYYIRKPFISISFIKLLSKIKKKRKNVVLEIPTYPYKKELTGVIRSIFYFYERFSTLFLKDKLDFITFYGEEFTSIWGVKSLRLENGICPEKIKLVPAKTLRENKLRLIAVGNLSKWHGYERLLTGLSLLKNDTVTLDIVGKGSAYDELKCLSTKLNLDAIVTFHGFKSGNDLDDIYSTADIGIGSLGMYKLGMVKGSTLKAREFSARGIPFILGYEDLAFPPDIDFVKYVPNDSSPLNLNDVIDWFNDNSFYSDQIRQYAFDNLTWDIQVERIVAELGLLNKNK